VAKRGPKTEKGKSVVRLNAIQHGGLSTVPVIPGLEREEDWQAHSAGVLSSLTPEGHLETTLADRVALLLWRLARIARYECAMIDSAQERISEDLLMRVHLNLDMKMTQADYIAQERERLRRERVLPNEQGLGKVIRYEAHLHRQLLQTLHELEAIQARRQGLQTPLARVDVQGLRGE
jgi:hypothetical protein